MRLIRSAFGQGRDISVQSGNGPTLMCLDLTPLCALVAVLCTVTQVVNCLLNHLQARDHLPQGRSPQLKPGKTEKQDRSRQQAREQNAFVRQNRALMP